MKDIITQNKKEGGEGAFLFDTPLDADLGVGGNRGENNYVGEKVEDGVGEPEGETLFLKSGDDEVVVNGVKSFAVVGEEDESFLVFLDFPVVGFVESPKMIGHLTSG